MTAICLLEQELHSMSEEKLISLLQQESVASAILEVLRHQQQSDPAIVAPPTPAALPPILMAPVAGQRSPSPVTIDDAVAGLVSLSTASSSEILQELTAPSSPARNPIDEQPSPTEEAVNNQETSGEVKTQRQSQILFTQFVSLCQLYQDGGTLQGKLELSNDPIDDLYKDKIRFQEILTAIQREQSNFFTLKQQEELCLLEKDGYLPYSSRLGLSPKRKQSKPHEPEAIGIDNEAGENDSDFVPAERVLTTRASKKKRKISRVSSSSSQSSSRKKRKHEGSVVIPSANKKEDDSIWWKHFTLLVEYHSSHGNFQVPLSEIIRLEEENVFLGLWLSQEKRKLAEYFEHDLERYNALSECLASDLLTIEETPDEPSQSSSSTSVLALELSSESKGASIAIEKEDPKGVDQTNNDDMSESLSTLTGSTKVPSSQDKKEGTSAGEKGPNEGIEKVTAVRSKNSFVAFEYKRGNDRYLGLGAIVHTVQDNNHRKYFQLQRCSFSSSKDPIDSQVTITDEIFNVPIRDIIRTNLVVDPSKFIFYL
jgi:hypothetical protein